MKLTDAVRLAFAKGYRVNQQGNVFSPVGRQRRLQVNRSSETHYFRFNISDGNGKTAPVAVHKLVAFQKFGEASFTPGVHTRHRDNNSFNNRPENILLGTPTENSLDRPVLERRKHAAKGFQKHTAETIAMLRAEHANGVSYKTLEKIHKIPRSTLSYYLSNNAKRTTFTFAKPHGAER